jgi:hypothetical protein
MVVDVIDNCRYGRRCGRRCDGRYNGRCEERVKDVERCDRRYSRK